MKYAGLLKNDFTAAPGVCVTFYTQGCPHRCDGCQNPETWDFDGGKEVTPEVIQEVVKAINSNELNRSLCIQGGEPLCEENQFLTLLLIDAVLEKHPETKIYIWTGYIYENLIKHPTPHLKNILSKAYCLIDGPYIKEERDITLPMRGSRNQRIIYLDKE